jgi:DNA-binding NarL/FixJ family response regulator
VPEAGSQSGPWPLPESWSAVLQLLAEGHTDETIANRLDVSTRTIRRITKTLMNQLQARSRFQAGINATRQGWIHH